MNNVLVILTTTVVVNNYKLYIHQKDPNERKNTYFKSIKQWLEKTNLKICVVENSGYTFPELDEYLKIYEDRFEIITFDEIKHPPELKHYVYNNSKGASEIFAINYAYKNTKFKSSIDFIIKVTGRYFIDSFEGFLKKHDLSNRCNQIAVCNYGDRLVALTQNNDTRCEIVGCHILLIPIIFNTNMNDHLGIFHTHVEFLYKNRIKLINANHILKCDEFEIEPTQMGGTAEIIYKL